MLSTGQLTHRLCSIAKCSRPNMILLRSFQQLLGQILVQHGLRALFEVHICVQMAISAHT